ncbi:MAG: DUF1330 domain-containing protein [Acidimicrobiia bacterium]|nr:DUF1330 domain-containing protein [Acidimicrobiia bacterium]
MAAYIIVNVDVLNPDRYPEYVKAVPPTLAAYGGRFMVRGGRAERLEGTIEPKRVVVIEFENAERARAWWSSAEYAGPKALRQATAKTDMILVEGL